MACFYTNLMAATLVGFVASHTNIHSYDCTYNLQGDHSRLQHGMASLSQTRSAPVEHLSHTLWLFTDMLDADCASFGIKVLANIK